MTAGQTSLEWMRRPDGWRGRCPNDRAVVAHCADDGEITLAPGFRQRSDGIWVKYPLRDRDYVSVTDASLRKAYEAHKDVGVGAGKSVWDPAQRRMGFAPRIDPERPTVARCPGRCGALVRVVAPGFQGAK